jgi:hypothetical protein
MQQSRGCVLVRGQSGSMVNECLLAINSTYCKNGRTRFDLQGASGGKPASSRRSLPGNLCSKEVWPRAKASTSRTITEKVGRCVTRRVSVSSMRGICALVRE